MFGGLGDPQNDVLLAQGMIGGPVWAMSEQAGHVI